MWTNEEFRKLLQQLTPLLEASLDPVAVINLDGEVVYMDLAMKSALGLRGREMRKRLVFCDMVKLSCCEKVCQVKEALKKGVSFRADDLPAMRKLERLRVSFKVVPIFESYPAETTTAVIGAIVTLRDTTSEILLQAKYHKLKELLRDGEAELSELRERTERLQISLKSARNRVA